MGTDYFSYKETFYQIAGGTDTSIWLEQGYHYLNLFIYKIGFDYHWVFAAMSFFTILFLFLSVSKRVFWIIIPIYALTEYVVTYNTVRQGLTMTMGFYAYTMYSKKKYIQAFIIIGIGYFFHKSILLLIPILLIMNFFKIGKELSIVYFLAIVVVVKLFGYDIVELGYTNLLDFLGYGYKVNNAYSFLITKVQSGYGVLLRIGMLFVMLYSLNNIKGAVKLNENFLYKVRFWCIFYLFMDALTAWTLNEIGRVKMVYNFALFIPLATIYNYSRYRKLFFLVFVLWVTMNFYLLSKSNTHDVFPYKCLLF